MRGLLNEFRALKLLLKRLRRENSLSTVANYFLLSKRGKRQSIVLRICGEDVLVRTSSPDLDVALSTLGDEFQPLERAHSKARKGLIIDAGGYIGTAAIALSKMYPEATIVSVEPSRENFDILERNVQTHENIHAYNAALMPASFGATVELMNRGTGEWGYTVIKNPRDRPASFIEKVDVLTIDTILEKYGFDRIMIFKMDIEGAEFSFLKETDWLDKTQVLMIELHERIVAGCEQAFEDANKLRFVCEVGGEKLISIGRAYFA